MVDVVASIAIIGGSLLAALGSLGLLLFPDVLTRMHAATKAATVGVIATVAAAALEAGAVGGVLVLLLVVLLLFLSSPLGMSLLARAAYHDDETPRAAATRELDAALPIPETFSIPTGRGTSPLLALWLFLAWIAAFGSVAPNVVVGGAIVAGAVAYAFRHLSPRWPRLLLHPLAAARFFSYFLVQLVRSTWDVVLTLRVPADRLRPAIIEVPLRVRNRTEVALLMNSISFTPGTVALELHDEFLYVHALDVDDPQEVIASIAELERRIMAMFGTTTAVP